MQRYTNTMLNDNIKIKSLCIILIGYVCHFVSNKYMLPICNKSWWDQAGKIIAS